MLTKLVLAIASAILLHLLAMTISARVLGITVRTVTFGIGPQVFVLGRFRLCIFPLGGHIRLAMLADTLEGEPVAGALDRAGSWKRVLLPLSGPLVLLGVGTLLLGVPAIDQFTQAFAQLVGGAVSPLGRAQGLLHGMADGLTRMAAIQVFGVTACKVSALNLLPFLGSNGLAAATAWLPQVALDGNVMARIHSFVILPVSILMFVSWLLAIVVFVFSG